MIFGDVLDYSEKRFGADLIAEAQATGDPEMVAWARRMVAVVRQEKQIMVGTLCPHGRFDCPCGELTHGQQLREMAATGLGWIIPFVRGSVDPNRQRMD